MSPFFSTQHKDTKLTRRTQRKKDSFCKTILERNPSEGSKPSEGYAHIHDSLSLCLLLFYWCLRV